MIFFDVETYSEADLREVGGRRYSEHKSTRLLTLVAKVDGSTLIYAPEKTNKPLDIELVSIDDLRQLADRPWVAHNCYGFDRFIVERFLGISPEWVDTLPLARAAGYPGSLDDLGRLFTGEGKSKLKTEAMKLTRGKRFPVLPVGQYRALIDYCIQDVVLLERVYEKVRNYGEPDVIRVDREINDRGVYVDVDLVDRVEKFAEESALRAGAEIERLTGGEIKATDLRRTEFIRSWVSAHGLNLPDLQKDTVDRVLEAAWESETEVEKVAIDVLRLRQSATKITSGKLQRMRDMVSDDRRLRDMFLYHGATTGRWTGRGVQLHNLTRGVSKPTVEEMLECRSIDELASFGTPVDDCISTLIRPCLTATPGRKLLIADYAAIEARGVAWVAGERKLLELFELGGDPYCHLASEMFGRTITKKDPERQIGKIGILGCGYGMSGGKLSLFAAKTGLDLKAAGVTGEEIVETYRSTYPRIAGRYKGERDGRVFRQNGIWHRYERAAKNALDGRVSTVGFCTFEWDGRLIVTLPSGRPLIYRNARFEDRVPAYDPAGEPRPTLVYDSPRGERTLYGGLITENIVQAICRDLLASTLVQVPNVVLHVHDEVVCDGGGLDDLCRTMSTPPSWAKEFPITVEGYESERYVKKPPAGAYEVVYSNGVKK